MASSNPSFFVGPRTTPAKDSGFKPSTGKEDNEAEKYAPSFLFSRYPASSKSPDEEDVAESAPLAGLKRNPITPHSTRYVGYADQAGTKAQPDFASFTSPVSVSKSKIKAPPRRSVLDDQNGIFGASFDDSKTPTRAAAPTTADRRGGGRVMWNDTVNGTVVEDIDEGTLNRRAGMSALREPVNTSRMDTSVIYAASAGGGSVSKSTRPNRGADQNASGSTWSAAAAAVADSSSSLADVNGLYDPVHRTPADKRSWLDEHNPFSEEELDWQRWVVVFGYSANGSGIGLNRILQRFQEFGSIDKYNASNGNWVFVRYSTPKEAQSAERLNGSFLDGTQEMIGVIRLFGESSEKFRNMLRESEKPLGAIAAQQAPSSAVRNRGTTGKSRDAMVNAAYRQHLRPDNGDVDEEIILRAAPKKKKSICSKIYDFFFLY